MCDNNENNLYHKNIASNLGILFSFNSAGESSVERFFDVIFTH